MQRRSYLAVLALLYGIAGTSPASASSYRILYSFRGSDAAYVDSGVILAGNMLYGVSYYGGRYGNGTLFSIDPATGAETTLHAFAGGSDGANPGAGLTYHGGRLYGTTYAGGSGNWGTIFWFNPTNLHMKTFYACKGHRDCGNPSVPLLNDGSVLYGDSVGGGIDTGIGRQGDGVVYAVNPLTGAEHVVSYFWSGNDKGFDPRGSVIRVGRELWGMTWTGSGAAQYGTIYAVNSATGARRLVADLTPSTGSNPSFDFVNAGGMLYGTATSGGAGNAGTLFSVDPKAGTVTVVYAFKGGKDADSPNGLIDVGGKLIGTSYYGGTYGSGVLFSVDPATGVETILHVFGAAGDGAHPIDAGNLIEINGTLYGTTSEGGAGGVGTVFALTP